MCRSSPCLDEYGGRFFSLLGADIVLYLVPCLRGSLARHRCISYPFNGSSRRARSHQWVLHQMETFMPLHTCCSYKCGRIVESRCTCWNQLRLSPASSHTATTHLYFFWAPLSFSRRHRRPHRAPTLNRTQPASRPAHPVHLGSIRGPFGRLFAPSTPGSVPRRPRALSSARCTRGGNVCVGERSNVRDSRRGDVFGFRGR
jgi:hypothetical protein